MNSWPVVSSNPWIQAEYEIMRERGESHNIAKICATGRTPALMTDDVFLADRRNNAQFVGHPKLGNFYKGVAEREGIDTTGRTYISGLAAYPGDPRAWVNGRGDAKRLLEERGWSSEGAVNVRGREPLNPIDDPAIDPRLIDSEASHREATGQMLGCSTVQELKEKLTDIRGWKPDSEIGKEV